MSVFFRFHDRSVPGRALLCLLFFSCLAASVPGEELTETTWCTWLEPTNGTPVEYYVLELEKTFGNETLKVAYGQNQEIEEESFQFKLEFGYRYRARVAGVDAEGRQGPWSLWSDAYVPEATPGDFGGD